MATNKYNTNQRDIILKFLMANKDKHITVDEIQSHLKENDSPVSKTTIYRYFDLLIDDGEIIKYPSINGKSACYQYLGHNAACNHHYHLFCDSCNQLLHIECDFLDRMNSHLNTNHNFKLNSFSTVFHGLCEKCGGKIC